VSDLERRPSRDFRIGIVRCVVAAVLFGSTVPLASLLVSETSAPMLAGWLYVGAAVAVLPFLGGVRETTMGLCRGGWLLAVAVVAGGLLGPLLLVAGLARTPAATASLLLNLELAATAVVAALAFREHIGRRLAFGIILVLCAGVVLTRSGTPELRLGALFVIGACICWGIDNAATAGLDALVPQHITFAKGAFAGTANIVIAVAVGSAVPQPGVIAAALALGAVGYGASITLWISGAQKLGAARGQLVFATAPFVGVVVAWTVLGDDVLASQVVALVVAATGVLLVFGSGHEHDHMHLALDHIHEHEHDPHHQHVHDQHDAHEPHSHRHTHEPLVHAHPHVPDLHHRHEHSET
jgi:drug/metabolite transporter (DMT)-like permease